MLYVLLPIMTSSVAYTNTKTTLWRNYSKPISYVSPTFSDKYLLAIVIASPSSSIFLKAWTMCFQLGDSCCFHQKTRSLVVHFWQSLGLLASMHSNCRISRPRWRPNTSHLPASLFSSSAINFSRSMLFLICVPDADTVFYCKHVYSIFEMATTSKVVLYYIHYMNPEALAMLHFTHICVAFQLHFRG